MREILIRVFILSVMMRSVRGGERKSRSPYVRSHLFVGKAGLKVLAYQSVIG